MERQQKVVNPILLMRWMLFDRESFGDTVGGETAEDSEATNTVAQSDHVDAIDALDRGCRWRDSIGF